MKKFYFKAFSFFYILLLSSQLNAQVGVYDPSFGTGGKIFQVFSDGDVKPTAVLVQPDGKIVVGGGGGDFFSGLFKIVRYNPDGSPDNSFGTGGTVTFNNPNGYDLLHSMVIQPDGKLVIGGVINTLDPVTQSSNADYYLFRLTSAGVLDSTFGINGIAVTDLDNRSEDYLQSIYLKPDGKILAGGYGLDVNTGDNIYGLVQYKDNGTRDSTFGTNGITIVQVNQQDESRGDLGILPNGQIIAATNVVSTAGFYEFGLLRFHPNGIPDTGFGTGGILHLSLSYFHSMLEDMAIQPDGKILLTGQTDQNNRSVIAVVRVDSNGAYDPTFGVNGVVRTHISDGFTPDVGNTITVQPDNKIIIGATLDNAINSMDANFAVVRYLPNGTIDSLFGRQGIIITDFNEYGDFATAAVQQADGKLILAGSAESASYETGFGIVRYLNDARSYYNTVKASVFMDNNSNGTMDAGEQYFNNAVLSAVKNNDTIAFTSSNGRFNAEIDTGSFVFTPLQPGNHVPYYNSVPATQSITNVTYFNTDSISFAMQPIPGMKDIFVNMVPFQPARPGFSADYVILYGNNGTDTIPTGIIKYVPDSHFVIDSTSATHSVSGDTLVWNYTNLYPGDTSFIMVYGRIQPPPQVNIGDTLISNVIVEPVGADQYPADNFFRLVEEVGGSFDPNDKNESHGGTLTTAELNSREFLQYIIRFQNTGTDTAFNIYIRDTLENTLHWNSMQMVMASHPYKLVRENGICVWSFNNIRLEDSTRNEPQSHGFVVFRIRAKAGLTEGQTISNKASIYFDYNLPVVTNTHVTEIRNAGSLAQFNMLSFTAERTGNENLLTWRAMNESTIDRYEIERSADGIAYSMIGTETAIPTPGGATVYTFTDDAVLSPVNYYRIKIIERNGAFTYSVVRIVETLTVTLNTVKVYPNPVRNIMQVKIESVSNSTVHVQVIAIDGRVLYSSIWFVESGSTVKDINTTSFPKGSYLLNTVIMPSTGNVPGHKKIIRFEKL